MNKSAKTTKVYAISLSLIFLANVLFLQGNISVFSIQLAFSEDPSNKNPIVVLHAGETRNLTANSNTSNGDSITYTWIQEGGPDMLNGKNSFIGGVLQITPTPASYDQLLIFNVTATSGLAKNSEKYYFMVPADKPPKIIVDHDQIIDTKKYCNTSNSSQPTQAPQFELNGKGIDEGNLTYFWSALNYQSLINITQHPESPKATFTVKNLCDLVGKTNVIFMLNGTDIANQSAFGTLVYTIQPSIKAVTITIS